MFYGGYARAVLANARPPLMADLHVRARQPTSGRGTRRTGCHAVTATVGALARDSLL